MLACIQCTYTVGHIAAHANHAQVVHNTNQPKVSLTEVTSVSTVLADTDLINSTDMSP